MISSVASIFLCIGLLLCSIAVIAIKIKEFHPHTSNTGIWITSIAIFVVLLNILFQLLSVLPIAKPIRLLALPLHLTILLATIFTIKWKNVWAWCEGMRSETRNQFRTYGYLHIILGLFIVVVFLAWAVQGALTVSHGTDEMSYHGPQAFGIYQEGRIRDFNAYPSWIYYYPQGAAVLWSWTMLFTASDLLFRVVQLMFALQLVLATGWLAAKCGACARSRLLAVLLVCSMPIFYVLSTTIGGDLGYSAAMISFLAVLAPKVDAPVSDDLSFRFATALIFLAEAAFIKIPILPLIYFSLAIVAFLWGAKKNGNGKALVQGIKASRFFLFVLVCLGFGFATYVVNWIDTGNPFFPLTIRFAGTEVFKGPLLPMDEIVAAKSSWGDVHAMNALQRWYGVFGDWFQTLSQDSFGGAGPVFLVVVIALAISEMMARLAKPNAWTFAMLGILVSVFVIPGAYLPRYSLVWLCVLIVLSVIAYDKISRILPGILVVIALGAGMGFAIQANSMIDNLNWRANVAAPIPLYVDRGRSVFEKFEVNRKFIPSPAILKAIRLNVKDGQTFYYSIKVFASTIWNRDFSNVVRYFPISKQPDWIDLNTPHGDITDWLGTVQKDKPDWLVVYAISDVTNILTSASLATRYKVVERDELSGNSEADQWNAVLLRRIN